MPNRPEVVACARAFLGTPWVHQGRTRLGVDCAGLPIGVAKALGLTGYHGLATYSRTPTGQTIREVCDNHLVFVANALPGDSSWLARADLGDVLILALRRYPIHMGILADGARPFSLIHAYSPLGAVVEHRLDEDWRRRARAVYRYPGVT